MNLQNMWEAALFSGKIYTADKNFTRPPVATVATNSKSAGDWLFFCRGNDLQSGHLSLYWQQRQHKVSSAVFSTAFLVLKGLKRVLYVISAQNLIKSFRMDKTQASQ